MRLVNVGYGIFRGCRFWFWLVFGKIGVLMMFVSVFVLL